MKRSVIGLDLSLRATAMIYLPEEWARTHDWSLIKYATVGGKLHKHSTATEVVEHIADIACVVCAFARDFPTATVFVEQYAFSRSGAYAHAIGELGGVVKHELAKMGRYATPVVASSARKIAFGTVPRGVDVKRFIEKRLQSVGAPFAAGKAGEDQRDAFVISNFGLTEIGLPAMTIPEMED